MIAVGLVLSAVFVPCAFISGITGQFFRQFALTIAASTIISTFNSLTLSPALGGPAAAAARQGNPRSRCRGWPFRLLGGWLGYAVSRALARHAGWQACRLGCRRPRAALRDRACLGSRPPWLAVAGWLLGRLAERHSPLGVPLVQSRLQRCHRSSTPRAVGRLLRVSVLVLVVYGGLLVLTYWGFTTTPKGFIPSQDMGYLLVNVQLPDAASAERTPRRHRSRAANLPAARRASSTRWPSPASRSCSAHRARTSARCS